MSPDTREPSLDEVRHELRQEIHASAAQVRQELRQEIQAGAAGIREELRQEIQASAVETRRHFDVVAEGLRSEIRLLAEGIGTLDQKVERFREEVREEFHKVDRRFLRLEAERL